MTSAIRVLIADDSVVNRQMLKKILSNAHNIEVVALASNGKIAVDRIPQCNPDLVILDVEMPEMNGLEALKCLRQTHPKLPVIMFSALTAKGAATTIEALSLGANDYVTKPNANTVLDRHSPEAVEGYIYEKLIPRIYALYEAFNESQTASSKAQLPSPPSSVTPPARSSQSQPSTQRVQAVGIGISTGGPSALAQVLSALPEHLAVPIFIVQHMPPLFTRYLAERLNSLCKLHVCEAEDGMLVEAHHVYLAPGDYHMGVQRQHNQIRIVLNQEPHENSCRPAVDVLFRHLAAVYGAHVLALVMTGMGKDGLRGCEKIHAEGGAIFIQDEESSTIWGMPSYVARAELAEKIIPLSGIATAIVQRVQLGR